MLDAVLDVDSQLHLVNADKDETEFSHEYVKKLFESRASYIAYRLNPVVTISARDTDDPALEIHSTTPAWH
jgi:hypothetical protein